MKLLVTFFLVIFIIVAVFILIKNGRKTKGPDGIAMLVLTFIGIAISDITGLYNILEDSPKNEITISAETGKVDEYTYVKIGRIELSEKNNNVIKDMNIFKSSAILDVVISNKTFFDIRITNLDLIVKNIVQNNKAVIIPNLKIEPGSIILETYNDGWGEAQNITIVIEGSSNFERLTGKKRYEILYPNLRPGEKREITLITNGDVYRFGGMENEDYMLKIGLEYDGCKYSEIANLIFKINDMRFYDTRPSIGGSSIYFGMVFSTAGSTIKDSMKTNYVIPAYKTEMFKILVAPDQSCTADINLELTINNRYKLKMDNDENIVWEISYFNQIHDGRYEDYTKYNDTVTFFPIGYIED